jgi:hypothetical protein
VANASNQFLKLERVFDIRDCVDLGVVVLAVANKASTTDYEPVVPVSVWSLVALKYEFDIISCFLGTFVLDRNKL